MTPLRLTVSSGMGPREARQFVRRLASSLGQELAARGFRLDHEVVYGPAAEPLSIDLVGLGERQRLGDLLGTHALVERSALRGKRARKRWFVAVELHTAETQRSLVSLRIEDVRFETCRAGGAGGQHVNRTESAVRACHAPSGLSVRVESSRSQHANRASALSFLAAALARREAGEEARERSERRARALHVQRGNPVAVWRDAGSALLRADDKGTTHA